MALLTTLSWILRESEVVIITFPWDVASVVTVAQTSQCWDHSQLVKVLQGKWTTQPATVILVQMGCLT